MSPSMRRKATSISSWAILRICFFCRSVKAGRRPWRLPFFLRALRGIGDFLVRFIIIFFYGVASQSAQSEEEKEAMGAALGAPRSSSAFDSPHQRPAYNCIMARAWWKSFAFVQHNLVVAGVAAVNPRAVVTVSASLHDFLLKAAPVLDSSRSYLRLLLGSAERGVPRQSRSLRGRGFVHAASEESHGN